MREHEMPKKRSDTVEREIDQNLKRAFDALASEPLPDRFTSLLDQLKAKETSDNASASDDQEGRND
ncbi:MAG: NepR family anti-sigma factor [Pseudomonadota bacterium]|jgi:ppGpp synthetase/RelA/SpoT-type nucleotidyltranferase|nr:NepR family anti-sigma factor [Pseudomonadota bacterium]